MRKSVLLLFMVALVLTSGCLPHSEPLTEAKDQPFEYFPLNPGNSWSYLGEGNEYAAFTREVIYSEGNLYQTTEDNGGTVSSTVYMVSDEAVEIVYSMGEEYDMENALTRQPNTSDVILRIPFEPGNTWKSSDTVVYEIISVTETVVTPAGTWSNCIKVMSQYPDSVIYRYYCSGIGMVKSEFVSGDIIITSSLDSYLIN